MSDVLKKKLKKYFDLRYNVLLKGRHGTGKTSTVIDVFKELNIKYLYFSASTMDPWVDFIGVPKEVQEEDGKSYLELIRPKAMSNDEVEAIFFDELNRSSKKIRNAIMEFLQFKSINGVKYNNLKVIWGAINPDDDEELTYDVEKLDPAQVDRFQVQIDIPYLPDKEYFNNKYGNVMAEKAIFWWKSLSTEQKKNISPRRLDYILDSYINDVNINDIIPNSINAKELISSLKIGPLEMRVNDAIDNKNEKNIKELLSGKDALDTIDIIANIKKDISVFTKYISEEYWSKILDRPVKYKNILECSENDIKNNLETKIIDVIADKYKNINKSKGKKILKSLSNFSIITDKINELCDLSSKTTVNEFNLSLIITNTQYKSLSSKIEKYINKPLSLNKDYSIDRKKSYFISSEKTKIKELDAIYTGGLLPFYSKDIALSTNNIKNLDDNDMQNIIKSFPSLNSNKRSNLYIGLYTSFLSDLGLALKIDDFKKFLVISNCFASNKQLGYSFGPSIHQGSIYAVPLKCIYHITELWSYLFDKASSILTEKEIADAIFDISNKNIDLLRKIVSTHAFMYRKDCFYERI